MWKLSDYSNETTLFLAILSVRCLGNSLFLQNTYKFWTKDNAYLFKYITELKGNK